MSYTACAEHTPLLCKERVTMGTCVYCDLGLYTSSMSTSLLSPLLVFVPHRDLDWWSWRQLLRKRELLVVDFDMTLGDCCYGSKWKPNKSFYEVQKESLDI